MVIQDAHLLITKHKPDKHMKCSFPQKVSGVPIGHGLEVRFFNGFSLKS